MSEYSITLKVGNDLYQGTGESPEEAIESFPMPTKIPLKAMVEFAKDGKKKEIFLVPWQIKRLGLKPTRIMLKKQFMFGLK